MRNEDTDKLVFELMRDEGKRLKPYRCSAGKLTIGYGRNLDDCGITSDEAEYLLRNDIRKCEQDLDTYLSWWRIMHPVRQRALVNMCFNLGIGGLLGFKNTLELIKNGQFLAASQKLMESKWAHQVGDRAKRIALMFRDGGVV